MSDWRQKESPMESEADLVSTKVLDRREEVREEWTALNRSVLTLGCSLLIASTGLAMRAAEVKGQVLFDPVEATLYTEMVKLTATIAWAVTAPAPRSTQIISHRSWLAFTPAAAGYFVVNNLRFELVRIVNPGLLAVLWNLKVVVIAALYSLPPFYRALSARQWLGASLLVLGTTGAQLSEFKLARGANSGGIFGFTLVAFLLVLTSASAVACEFAYKAVHLPLRFQNLVLYTQGCVLNYCMLVLRRPSTPLGAGFSGWTWTVVCLQAGAGYCVGAIFKYVDAVGQVVADVLAVIISTSVSVVFFGLLVDLRYALSLLISLFAILVYYSPYYTSVDHQPAFALTHAVCPFFVKPRSHLAALSDGKSKQVRCSESA